MFRAMAEHAQARLHCPRGIDAEPAVPARLIDLDGVVHHVADEETLVLAVQQPQDNLAG